MFCPKCGTQNQIEQKYCRGCGHGLAGHLIALKGNIEGARKNIRVGSNLVGVGLIIIGICKLNILLNLFLGADRTGTIFNVALVLITAVPLILLGVNCLARAGKLLLSKDEPDQDAIGVSTQDLQPLPAAPATGSISISSVTEHTTFELKEPERVRRQS